MDVEAGLDKNFFFEKEMFGVFAENTFLALMMTVVIIGIARVDVMQEMTQVWLRRLKKNVILIIEDRIGKDRFFVLKSGLFEEIDEGESVSCIVEKKAPFLSFLSKIER